MSLRFYFWKINVFMIRENMWVLRLQQLGTTVVKLLILIV